MFSCILNAAINDPEGSIIDGRPVLYQISMTSGVTPCGKLLNFPLILKPFRYFEKKV